MLAGAIWSIAGWSWPWQRRPNDGPHISDIAMATLLPELYRANVGALSIEFANPRHQHEYEALKGHPLPAHMLLIPGVLDTTTNFVEHPQVVAKRLREAVAAVGDKERIIAGTDCGFSTFAGREYVASEVVWHKLAAMAEGARIASDALWGRRSREDQGLKTLKRDDFAAPGPCLSWRPGLKTTRNKD